MKFEKNRFLLCVLLGLFLNGITARPADTGPENGKSGLWKHPQTKQNRGKITRGVYRNSLPDKGHISQVSRQGKVSRVPSPLKQTDEVQKRQFIYHPPNVSPYLMMRRPPLTQRTIVTTRIPRPPMPIPYNPYDPYMLQGSLYGGGHFPYERFHHGFAHMYGEEEEEDDEGLFGL